MIACRVSAAVCCAAVFGAVLLWGGPAAAQFGIFGGDQPPRPPTAVTGSPPAPAQPQPPTRSQPGQPFTQGALLPPGPPPGRIQSEDLPPPPGSTLAPAGPQPAALPRPPGAPAQAVPTGPAQVLPSALGQPPGQRPPPRSTAAAPPDDAVTPPPTQKIVNPTAMFSGLDKITGRITSFDAAIGETVQFGALQVTPRACYTRPPTETPLTDGFVEVDEVTLQGEVRRIFTGWMFAASPGLHAVEHAIYDVWLTDCKGGAQAVAEAPPPPPPAAAPAARTAPAQRQPTPSQQRQAQPPRQPSTGAVLQPPLIR
jgi:hypothetical protein